MLGAGYPLKLSGIAIAIGGALNDEANERSSSSQATREHYLGRAYEAYEEAFVMLTCPSTSDKAWEYLFRPASKARLQRLASAVSRPGPSVGVYTFSEEERLRAVQVSSQLANIAGELAETISDSGEDGPIRKKAYEKLEYHHSFWALAASRKLRVDSRSQSKSLTSTARPLDSRTQEYDAVDFSEDMGGDSSGFRSDEGFLLERCASVCSRRGETECVLS